MSSNPVASRVEGWEDHQCPICGDMMMTDKDTGLWMAMTGAKMGASESWNPEQLWTHWNCQSSNVKWGGVIEGPDGDSRREILDPGGKRNYIPFPFPCLFGGKWHYGSLQKGPYLR